MTGDISCTPDVRPGDSPQLGRNGHRNNVVDEANAPTDWDVSTGANIRWSMPLGEFTHGSPTIANGKVYVGTGNGAGYVQRFPKTVNLGVLLCFRESDGQFLWQYSAEKLSGPGDVDIIRSGLCSTPVVDGDRVWVVSNRGEVVCLDSEGFLDGEDDGVVQSSVMARDEADVVWSFDMMKELGVLQRTMANCSPALWGDVLFVCTSNGAHGRDFHVPAPQAPSFLALDKHTGRVLWTDNSPGANILYGQWSSPAVGVFDGVAQVLFPGGDGWLYSFRADAGKNGKPEFLWKFDGNPKNAVYGDRSNEDRIAFLASPVIDNGRVYLSMAVYPTTDDRKGRLWCIDPRKQGDVSAELVIDEAGAVVPPRRDHQIEPVDGKTPRVIANPNSAVIWQYSDYEQDDGSFKTTLCQAIGAPAIRHEILVTADMKGVVHALNARTGVPIWTCQMRKTWGSPLIAGDNIFVGDQGGIMAILSLSHDPSRSINAPGGAGGRTGRPLKSLRVGSGIYTTPAYANGVLYVATKDRLFAIGAKN
ncbi:hypothetical protein AYO47_03330 [Planctomyces sp. SCGC AG-212-M04]|nr:hypothetical protein AYO47_03330 [Planctomyces sp. SCGC AG-212-M04]